MGYKGKTTTASLHRQIQNYRTQAWKAQAEVADLRLHNKHLKEALHRVKEIVNVDVIELSVAITEIENIVNEALESDNDA